jgi:hypothetical protein
MPIPTSTRPTTDTGRSVASSIRSVCPRMRWHSVNPTLPPPESMTCFARGPNCCVVSTAPGARRTT